MATNLIHELEGRLGLQPFVKIDPNTSREKNTDATQHNSLTQATVTAVLAGLYKYGRSEEGAEAILQRRHLDLNTIFNSNKAEVLAFVGDYAGETSEDVEPKMNTVLDHAVAVINDNIPEDATPETVKAYLADQRHSILSYLPAELHMGNVVDDNTIDDRTNKMEGPISSFMHFIGSAFSGSSDAEKETWNEAKN